MIGGEKMLVISTILAGFVAWIFFVMGMYGWVSGKW